MLLDGFRGMVDGDAFWGTTRKDGLRKEAAAAGDWSRDFAACLYPAHTRPVLVHRAHSGLVSSHLTRRILGWVSYRSGKHERVQEAYK